MTLVAPFLLCVRREAMEVLVHALSFFFFLLGVLSSESRSRCNAHGEVSAIASNYIFHCTCKLC
jgi:hypothetical protein